VAADDEVEGQAMNAGGARESVTPIADLVMAGRWDPEYFFPEHVEVERMMRARNARPLSDYITFITYGQVGKRVLSPKGSVRYLQVVNIRDTGIDFLTKPDRLAEGTHNDPQRSRPERDDVLFTNNSFGGMSRLLGRCIVVPYDYGKVNVSQDIDVIRVTEVDPYFVCAVIKSHYGQSQVQRLKYGVRSTKLSFQQVKQILIPAADKDTQKAVRKRYLRMAQHHEAAMRRKAELLDRRRSRSGRDREFDALSNEDSEFQRHMALAEKELHELLGAVEAYIRGEIDYIAA
jgi:hypothetical protein